MGRGAGARPQELAVTDADAAGTDSVFPEWVRRASRSQTARAGGRCGGKAGTDPLSVLQEAERSSCVTLGKSLTLSVP